MEWIGWSIVNRIGAPGFGKTLSEVITPKQFQGMTNKQWEKAGDPSKLTGDDMNAYLRSLAIARQLADRTNKDPTGGNQYFYSTTHEDDPPPGTFFPPRLKAGILEKTRRIGNFQFVRSR
jgi:spore germination cell wall hydrolase CwlJ-like protein